MATQKSTQLPIPLEIDADSWREGCERALAMFRDFRSIGLDELDWESDCRGGRPQENVAYGHLLGIISTRSDAVLAAFASVLTHYIGNCEHGGVPFVERDDDEVSARSLVAEMREPKATQVGRPSRARIAMKPFSGVANG